MLERGRVAETWRSERWDAFYPSTPSWTLSFNAHGSSCNPVSGKNVAFGDAFVEG